MNDSLDNLIDDLLIVIVIYKLPIATSPTWQSLIQCLPCPATIYIHDNSPTPHAIPDTSHQVQYRHDPTNGGVSKAYNEALVKSEISGKGWLLLLDQDTVITKDFFQKCENNVKRYPDKSFFAPILKDREEIISPFAYTDGISKKLKNINAGILSFENYRVANSGTLIHTTALRQAGGFDENLPLDFSDIYLQEKLSTNQTQFVLIGAVINHQFSGSKFKDRKESLQRYKIFSRACRTMADLTQGGNFRWISLKRAVNLSFHFFTIRFITCHFQVWSSR